MLKNKTRKSLKKQKKIKGGFECNMCDPEDRRSTRLSETLCGKEQCRMCLNCAKKSCISASLPEYRNEEAKQPKCPYCNESSEEVTNKCLEITKSDTIEDMISSEKSRLPTEPVFPQQQQIQNPLEILDHYDLEAEADAIEDIISKYNAICMLGIPYLIKRQMLPVGDKQNYELNLAKLFYETSYEFSQTTDSDKYDIFELIRAYNQQVATNRQLGNLFQQYRRILLVIRQKIQITEPNRSDVALAIANYLRSVLPSNTHNITNRTLHLLSQSDLNRDYFVTNYFDVDEQLSYFNITIEASIGNINENILTVFVTLINQILFSTQYGGNGSYKGKKIKGGVNEECPICLDDINNDAHTKLRCNPGHFLHNTCLETLKSTSHGVTTCPLCREVIDEPYELLIKYIDNEVFDDNMEAYQYINYNNSTSVINRDLITVLSYDIAGFLIEFKKLDVQNNGFNNEEITIIQRKLITYINNLLNDVAEESIGLGARDRFLVEMFIIILYDLKDIIYGPYAINIPLSLHEFNQLNENDLDEIKEPIATFISEFLINYLSRPKGGNKKKLKTIKQIKSVKRNRTNRKRQ